MSAVIALFYKMPNEPIEPGSNPELQPDLGVGGEGRVEAVSDETADFGYDGNWRGIDEPVEPAHEEVDLPFEAEVDVESVVAEPESVELDTESDPEIESEPEQPTRHDIPEELLRQLGLSWPEYCGRNAGDRRGLIIEKLQAIGESFDDGDVTTIEILLGSIADNSRQVVIDKPENNRTRPGKWRQWVTGLRTLGFSELGRVWARRSIAKINNEAPAEAEAGITENREVATETRTPTEIAEDAALRTTTSVTAARVTAAGITSALSSNFVGSNVARLMVDRIPFGIGAYLFGAVSGVSGSMTGQRVSYGLLRWSRNATTLNAPREELGERGKRGREARQEERQQVIENLKSHPRARFIYKLTNNRVWDYFADVDNRLTPADLDQIDLTNADGAENEKGIARIEEIIAVLQTEIDRRWLRKENGVDLTGEPDNWQQALYVKALTILANHNNKPHIQVANIEAQSNRIAKRVRGEQRMEATHYFVSQYIVGPLLGVGLAFNAYRARAQESGPAPAGEHNIKPENPNEILSSDKVATAIETDALRAIGIDHGSAHWSDVQTAINSHDDVAFFGLTGHHLTDLEYAEHALRAQLLEQLAHGQSHPEADVWHEDGTVDISILNQAGLAGVHNTDHGLVFDHLTTDQLTSQLQSAHAEVFSSHIFADWRINEVTTAVQAEAANLALAHHTNIDGLQTALHEHLNKLVRDNASKYDFSLTATNNEGVTLLRLEAQHFMADWLKQHQVETVSPLATALSTAGGHGHFEPNVVDNITGHPKPSLDFLPNFLAPEKHAGGLEHDVVSGPIRPLVEYYTGTTVEQPVLNIHHDLTAAGLWHGPKITEPSLTTHSDAVSVAQASGLAEPHHVAIDNGSQLTLPADTVRVASNHQAALETNNAASLEHQIFTKPVEVVKQAETVKPVLLHQGLHNFVESDDRQSILIGEADLGEQIPNEMDSFVAK